jgi:hypothetical protein
MELSGKKLDEYLKTSLNGDFGQILCIGYTKEDDRGNFSEGVLGWDAERERFSCDEAAMLTEFWALLRGFSPRTDIGVQLNLGLRIRRPVDEDHPNMIPTDRFRG